MQLNMQKIQEYPVISSKNEVGMVDVLNFDDALEKLSKKYNMKNRNEVEKFLKNHSELIQYIQKITPLIHDYFPNYQKCLVFRPDPEFDDLDDVAIYILGKNSSFKEEREKLENLNKDILYITDVSTQIKRLVSVGLWWL